MNNRGLDESAERDRGSAPIELAIIGPIAILLLGLMVLGGRVAIASQAITGVAGIAARDASLARTPAQAAAIARTSAVAALAQQNLHCQATPVIVVDTVGFAAAPGTPAIITVDVSCVVSFSQLAMPGLPGTRTLHDRAASPLDPFRTVSLGFSITDGSSSVNRGAGVRV